MNFENCLANKFSAGQWLGHFKALRIRLVEGGIQTRLHFFKIWLLSSGKLNWFPYAYPLDRSFIL